MRNQQGAFSLDILGGLFVLLVVMGLAWKALHDDTDARFVKQAADHSAVVAGAADRWIQKNQTAVAASAAPLATYTMTDIASELPSGFSPTNVYGQTYSVRVFKAASGALETVVMTTGGQTLDNKNVRKLATAIGGMAGYIDTATPTTIRGIFGGWSVPVATYGTSPGPGHIAMALFLSGAGVNDLYVYRNQVAGHPEYNTMNTPLIMAAVHTLGGACTQLGAISRDASGKVLSCDGTAWRSQGSAYWADPVSTYGNLPVCNAGSAWQTRVVQTPAVGSGPRAYTCNGAGSWDPLGIDNNGNLTVPARLTASTVRPTLIVAENALCGGYPEGTIAQSSSTSGLMLSCQSGVWKKVGGGGDFWGGASCPMYMVWGPTGYAYYGYVGSGSSWQRISLGRGYYWGGNTAYASGNSFPDYLPPQNPPWGCPVSAGNSSALCVDGKWTSVFINDPYSPPSC